MPHVAGNPGGQRQTLDPLGPELCMVVINTVWVLKVNDGSSRRAAKARNLEQSSFAKTHNLRTGFLY